jgi:hypothetical protein
MLHATCSVSSLISDAVTIHHKYAKIVCGLCVQNIALCDYRTKHKYYTAEIVTYDIASTLIHNGATRVTP